MISRIFIKMNISLTRRKFSRYLRISCWIFIFFFIIYLFIPLIFKSSTYLQRHFIFKYDVAIPSDLNFTNAENENMFGTYNRYIRTSPETKVGVWQILPESLMKRIPKSSRRGELDTWFSDQLKDSRPIIIYCHGNTPSRATPHRIAFYKILQKLDFHVISFDYRGFADSTAVSPTGRGLVEDALEIIRWVNQFSSSQLFIWGHSLGTGVATEAVAQLCRFENCPTGLVLQAPFTSIAEELQNIHATIPFRILPWFNQMFIEPLNEQGIVFNNEQNVKSVRCPILIIHSEDDEVVPFSLGKKLYINGKKNRPSNYGLMKFIALRGDFNYGHNDMYKDPQLPSIIINFFTEAAKH